mgnify:CR=1 FL=1
MKNKPILIVAGEPKSIFFEIFFKSLKLKKYKSPLILISSLKLLKLHMMKLKYKMKIRIIDYKNLINYKLDNSNINLINIDYNYGKNFEKITNKSNLFIKKSFDTAFDIIKLGITDKLINGPVSKKTFLDKKYLGITEYLAKKFKAKEFAMLIYNKELAVCPVTTHLPLKMVSKLITKKKIYEKVKLINEFYKKHENIIPNIAILGLNPHCESIHKYNEDEKIIKPTTKNLKKKYNVSGPYAADTIFLKENRKKINVVVGMYHDQVLTPLKTLYEYDAINITLGLPFIRISPDHGPNEKMLGMNKSNPTSLLRSIQFLDQN